MSDDKQLKLIVFDLGNIIFVINKFKECKLVVLNFRLYIMAFLGWYTCNTPISEKVSLLIISYMQFLINLRRTYGNVQFWNKPGKKELLKDSTVEEIPFNFRQLEIV